ncbi:MAG: methyltransferase domain-containing protein [Thermoanaerobaculia bacterium]
MSLLVPARRPQVELLDRGGLPPEEVEKSLADIRFVNRRWGGLRAAEGAAHRLLAPEGPGRGILLDLGSGTADVALAVARRARRRGILVRVVALDLQIAHLCAARRISGDGVPGLVAADALALPMADRSCDWVFSSLFLHHLSPDENVRVLREMARVARRGLFVIDLRRHRIARWIVGALGPVFFRSPVSVADGCASVEQAYTLEEVAAMARRAGLARFELRKVAPFRLELSART